MDMPTERSADKSVRISPSWPKGRQCALSGKTAYASQWVTIPSDTGKVAVSLIGACKPEQNTGVPFESGHHAVTYEEDFVTFWRNWRPAACAPRSGACTSPWHPPAPNRTCSAAPGTPSRRPDPRTGAYTRIPPRPVPHAHRPDRRTAWAADPAANPRLPAASPTPQLPASLHQRVDRASAHLARQHGHLSFPHEKSGLDEGLLRARYLDEEENWCNYNVLRIDHGATSTPVGRNVPIAQHNGQLCPNLSYCFHAKSIDAPARAPRSDAGR